MNLMSTISLPNGEAGFPGSNMISSSSEEWWISRSSPPVSRCYTIGDSGSGSFPGLLSAGMFSPDKCMESPITGKYKDEKVACIPAPVRSPFWNHRSG